mmetsp:Transcript_39944/g.106797  ORF Transcript_39944/g.106797 Transcript_39944/m.106797 type:complete len:262 (-) Transcript_39944:463-1248(-)
MGAPRRRQLAVERPGQVGDGPLGLNHHSSRLRGQSIGRLVEQGPAGGGGGGRAARRRAGPRPDAVEVVVETIRVDSAKDHHVAIRRRRGGREVTGGQRGGGNEVYAGDVEAGAPAHGCYVEVEEVRLKHLTGILPAEDKDEAVIGCHDGGALPCAGSSRLGDVGPDWSIGIGDVELMELVRAHAIRGLGAAEEVHFAPRLHPAVPTAARWEVASRRRRHVGPHQFNRIQVKQISNGVGRCIISTEQNKQISAKCEPRTVKR